MSLPEKIVLILANRIYIYNVAVFRANQLTQETAKPFLDNCSMHFLVGVFLRQIKFARQELSLKSGGVSNFGRGRNLSRVR